ncbi:MAG: acyl-ACP--UDP-N-acetylglucosamine O-acyltransferase [Gemmatimonadaceae bacterium]
MTAAMQEGTRIHPTAVIAPDAQIGANVEIGPYAVIGEDCVLGDGCALGARVTLERHVRLGSNVRVGVGSVLGSDPQDLKYRGEATTVEIGDGSVLREMVTVNRGTAHSMRTIVGRNCFLMSYSHVAHDCHLGDGVMMANAVQLSGHVTIEDRVIISGMSGVHQFVRVGAFAFVGGLSKVVKDVPPYLKAVGNPAKLYGLNSVGLQRNNFDPDVLRELKRAYRLFFRSELNLSQALERARTELVDYPEVRRFLEFVDNSQRGVVF